MTPNMMNTSLSPHLNEQLVPSAEATGKLQNDGMMDRYMDAARALCAEKNISVCDCYKRWKTLQSSGVDITELLANKINHPTRDMNWLFAISLLETMLAL